jgi:hypothetical protein
MKAPPCSWRTGMNSIEEERLLAGDAEHVAHTLVLEASDEDFGRRFHCTGSVSVAA